MKVRKDLSTDGLYELIRDEFGKIEEHRAMNVDIALVDTLMSGFAMFSLKDSSLLEFDERRERDDNLKQIYELEVSSPNLRVNLKRAFQNN